MDTEWKIAVYLGIFAAGILASQFGAAMLALHAALEKGTDGALPKWARPSAIVASFVTAWIAGAVAGAVLGQQSDVMGHSWQIGAVWGWLGSVVGPAIYPKLRGMIVETIRSRLGAKTV